MSDLRKEQLEAYVSLVGKVNRFLHSRLWWATDFSSKNRFNSRLPERLQSLIQNQRLVAVTQKDIILKFFKRLAGAGYHFFRLLFRYCFAKVVLAHRFEPVFVDLNPAYVIKTFVYDHSFAKEGTYKDAFFGQLPKFLEENGERVIFFANILGDFRSCIQKIAACKNAIIIPVDYFSSVPSICESAFVSCTYWPQLKEQIHFLGHPVRDIVNDELASCSGTIQPYQYLHYGQTQRLIKNIKVKAFLMTYENNPWEKMCMLALREDAPQAEIIGYQHTVTPHASVNMFISREEESVIPKPDRVLTVGQGPADIINRYTQIHSFPVEPACALRYESLWSLSPLPRTKTNAILLALEGIFDVYHMVNFVIEQLKSKPKYKVIIRCHPVLPVAAFSYKLVEKLENLPFVEISQGRSLIEDLARTDMTMYWGSTVSLESLWVGKPVIHFDQETIFSYDPLFDCPYLKKTVTARQDLTQVIENIYAISDADFASGRQKASVYLEKYFYPVNPQNLARFLPKI